MSLAGIFLITFLLVHLGINLLIVIFDDPMVYNKAAHFMSTNILIKIFEIVLFGGILLHIIYALILQIQNWMARPVRLNRPENSWVRLSRAGKYCVALAPNWNGGKRPMR